MSSDSTLRHWLAQQLPALTEASSVSLIAGDASPRRYYRVEPDGHTGSYIAVISPPSEKNDEFLHIRTLFEGAGVRVPALFAADPGQGYLLLEDLGDVSLIAALSDATAGEWYHQATAILVDIASIDPETAGLAPYDPVLLQTELTLFTDWFLGKLLQAPAKSTARFDALSQRLIASALEQPQVVVHRDFHCRNLMVVNNSELAAIDFQDAVIGPISYDAVSLLKDCYIAWPRSKQLAWLEVYRQQLIQRCQPGSHSIPPRLEAIDSDTFVRWFDLMGLQRHIKVLGIFARLSLRDGKHGYLDDLPLVLAYTRETLARYADAEPALGAFGQWFEENVVPRCEQQPWYRPVPYPVPESAV